MKILYIITKSEIGGAQMHVQQLMAAMVAQGHTVGLMSYPGGWLEAEARKIGVQFFSNKYFKNSYNPFGLLNAFSVIKRVTGDFNPDLIHCHSSFAGILTRYTLRGKIPTIFTAHSWAFTDGAPVSRKLISLIAERFAARYASKIICVSEFDRQLALQYCVAPSEKLVTIHNGVATDVPVHQQRTDNEVRIVSVGRLAYPKEYGLLIDAFATLSSNAILTIVGHGPMYVELNAKIQSLGLGQKISILSDKKPKDIPGILAASDIFVLLSKHEGFPMTILEAMSAGLSVVASAVGGISEAVDSTCGILVPNTQQGVIDALQTLLNDATARTTMGIAAHYKVHANFSLQQFLEITEGIYQDVLSKRAS